VTFRICIEETTTQLFYRTVEAPNREAAHRLGMEMIEEGTWAEHCDPCDQHAHVELVTEVTEQLGNGKD